MNFLSKLCISAFAVIHKQVQLLLFKWLDTLTCICIFLCKFECISVCMNVILCRRLWVWFISGCRRQWRSPISLYNYNYHVSASPLPQHCVGGTPRLQRLSQLAGVHACAPCQTSVYLSAGCAITSWWQRYNQMQLWHCQISCAFMWKPVKSDVLPTLCMFQICGNVWGCHYIFLEYIYSHNSWTEWTESVWIDLF